MKRCPHCGVQDHDEAILCKSCMRSFAAPPTRGASGETSPRSRSAIATALIRLVILGAVMYAAVQFDLPSKVIDRFNEWQRGPQEAAEEPAPVAAVAETPPVSPSPAPSPVPVETATPEPAAPAVERPVRADPPRPSPPPRPAAPSPPSAAAVPKPESRPPERPAATEPAPAAVQPLRVGGNIKAPTKLRDVRPMYPAAAQASRIQGIVIIEATIGADGRVSETRVLRSIPLLDDAALDAVRQWEYEPTLLNGAPVPVVMTVTVNFRLQ